jgi:hypothetical protein
MAVVADTNVDVLSTFYQSIAKQAQSVLGNVLGNITPVPIEIAGHGNFPYNYLDMNTNFSINTWTFLNSVMQAGEHGGVAFGQPLTNAYSTLISALSYQYSKADNTTLEKYTISSQQDATNLVRAYEQTFGPITQAQLTAANQDTKLDYIINYKVQNAWAGKNAPLTLTNNNIANLTDVLPELPASAQPLLGLISTYLGDLVSVLGLINSRGAASTLLTNLKRNTTAPTTGNGGISTSDGAMHVAFSIKEAMAAIDTALANTANQFTITFHVSNYTEDSTTVSVSGQGAGVIPIGDFLGIDVGASASYNMHTLNTQGDELDVTLTYTGVTLVDASPSLYQEDTKTGWFDPEPLREAVANHQQEVSGFQLTPWPTTYNFAAGGNFGYLSALIISAYPTVTISYANGSSSDYESKVTQSASVGVSLFGIRLGGVEQSFSQGKIKQHAQGAGFDITFAPNPPSGSALDQTAYIIAGNVEYPAAA